MLPNGNGVGVFNSSPAMGDWDANENRQSPKWDVAPQTEKVYNGSSAMDEQGANENQQEVGGQPRW